MPVLWAGLLLPPLLAQEPAKPAAEPAKADESKPTYVNSETCQACHEDIFNAFTKNPHFRLETDKKRHWEQRACESCHGPGSKHAESMVAADIRQPAKLAPSQTDKLCLSCHRNQPTHVGRIDSGHARSAIACTSCHSMHKPKELALNGRNAAINQQCTACHLNALASFQKPHAHPISTQPSAGNNGMSCLDCHNPHGTAARANLKFASANEPGCFRCHSDKRGPFAFEHAPVRTEGCATCHEPHGSTNPRMLTRPEVRLQCLECHSNISTQSVVGGAPPAFHDIRSPRYANCTTCHMKIHGSHVNRSLLR
ncbi:MAG: DmsE family decaheme c-type cytochrome [Acidobacteriota bacterium]